MNDLLPFYHLSDGAERPGSILDDPDQVKKARIFVASRETMHLGMIDKFWSAVPQFTVQVAAPELSC